MTHHHVSRGTPRALSASLSATGSWLGEGRAEVTMPGPALASVATVKEEVSVVGK